MRGLAMTLNIPELRALVELVRQLATVLRSDEERP